MYLCLPPFPPPYHLSSTNLPTSTHGPTAKNRHWQDHLHPRARRLSRTWTSAVRGSLSDADDRRCSSSTDTQDETEFKDQVSQYGISDLDRYNHPYVVFGNEGSNHFGPTAHGIKPLSVMAVVCGVKPVCHAFSHNKGQEPSRLPRSLIRSTASGTTPTTMMGISSSARHLLSLATACYGNSVNGNIGHNDTDVLYIAFTRDDAVPGNSPDWEAGSYGGV
jgi:hypothetical protein